MCADSGNVCPAGHTTAKSAHKRTHRRAGWTLQADWVLLRGGCVSSCHTARSRRSRLAPRIGFRYSSSPATESYPAGIESCTLRDQLGPPLVLSNGCIHFGLGAAR